MVWQDVCIRWSSWLLHSVASSELSCKKESLEVSTEMIAVGLFGPITPALDHSNYLPDKYSAQDKQKWQSSR